MGSSASRVAVNETVKEGLKRAEQISDGSTIQGSVCDGGLARLDQLHGIIVRLTVGRMIPLLRLRRGPFLRR
jgi:hypothetical protein